MGRATNWSRSCGRQRVELRWNLPSRCQQDAPRWSRLTSLDDEDSSLVRRAAAPQLRTIRRSTPCMTRRLCMRTVPQTPLRKRDRLPFQTSKFKEGAFLEQEPRTITPALVTQTTIASFSTPGRAPNCHIRRLKHTLPPTIVSKTFIL